MDFPSDASKNVLEEFASFSLGKWLGGGMSRQVYEHPTDKNKVIKIENSAREFQNVIEWEFWQNWQYDKDVSKWLAPCYSISYNGTFLIMDRTIPLITTPKYLPTFLTDHKLDNYGMLKGKLVCHDYGRIVTTLQMKHRKWGSRI